MQGCGPLPSSGLSPFRCDLESPTTRAGVSWVSVHGRTLRTRHSMTLVRVSPPPTPRPRPSSTHLSLSTRRFSAECSPSRAGVPGSMSHPGHHQSCRKS